MFRNSFKSKSTAIRLMNEYGSSKIPFLFIIDFCGENGWVIPLAEVDPAFILYHLPGKTNAIQTENRISEFLFRKYPEDYPSYLNKFHKVKNHIDYGNTYLLNLTSPTPVECSLGLEEIFHQSKAKYKLLVKDRFVVFSPESFVTIRNDIISSFPMKGTLDATIPDAEKLLLEDPKELAEHYTITDLIRNDLSSVAKEVRVEQFRYLERLETNFGALLQVSSRITGQLEKGYASRLGDILFRLLPAGSVSGAPKEKTVEIILQTEGYDRGFYTGIFGVFDGESLDSAVLIRFIESTDKGLIFKSGGGITSFSDPLKEYHEMIEKVYVPII
ncbi:MAG: aminodeoxychorismate synthase component I [Bacteroidales bacterium]|nr:aminodeoxychorismate synthase component I [Bacteroidales bacterium]